MKKIFNIFLGLICSVLVFANPADSTSIVPTDDVEQWLKEYATSDDSKTDTLVVAVIKSDSLSEKRLPELIPESLVLVFPLDTVVKPLEYTEITVVSWLDKIPLKPSDFITKEDSVKVRRDALKNARYNPLFMDEWVFSTVEKTDETTHNRDEVISNLRQGARSELFKENPAIYAYHESQLPNIDEIISKRIEFSPNEKIQVNKIASSDTEQLKIFKLAVSPWIYGTDLQVQISQNYISDNWYTGGESNLTTYFFIKGNVNYNNRKNIQWDNQLNAKFSFNTAGSDSLRLFRTNDDLFKLTSKLGIRIAKTKDFFYTAEGEFSTPFFNTYVTNSYQRVAGPFSPIRFYMSLGVDYKNKDLSIFLSPLSYKMIYVADTTMKASVTSSIADKVGIEPGRKIMNELGSKLKVKWDYEFSKEIRLETNFSLYTNYKGVEVDWEIIGNFIINRFISARVSLNPRYDSTIKLPDGEVPAIQFKELISFGFRYKI